jgi:DNA-binding response OmpR family regulator
MLNGKVLIIDDDTDILQVVGMILRKNGFKAVTFSSPPFNFVEEVIAIKPAVILLDVQLGGYDGRELGKQIKEVKKLAHIPVILFSANNHFKHDVAAYLCDDFIDKPFAVDFFMEKIRYYLQKE